jgi:GNAT superfamily N-acetyltransferase
MMLPSLSQAIDSDDRVRDRTRASRSFTPLGQNIAVVSLSTRRATADDVGVLITDVQSGFDSYVEFAPLGWVPPEVAEDGERIAERLRDSGTWALIALADAEPVGHIAFTPARVPAGSQAQASDLPIPGLAHLWQLFVLPAWWGRGVAPLLHDAAVAEARTREYEEMRLYTPALHARARRFYERRGWRWTDESWNHDLLLMLTEYRLSLT